MLCVSVLAGLGFHHSVKRNEWFVSMLIIFLIFFEGMGLYYPYSEPHVASADTTNFVSVSSAFRRNVCAWLEEQPEGTVILEYPRRPSTKKLAMYNQSFHDRKLVDGYAPFPPSHLREVDGDLGEWPSAKTVPVLRDWDVDYVILSTTSREDLQSALGRTRALAGLRHVRSFNEGFAEFTETHVFEVLQPGEEDDGRYLSLRRGFWAWEGPPERPFCWSKGGAVVTFPWPAQDPTVPADLALFMKVAGGRSPEAEPCHLVIEAEGTKVFEGDLPRDFSPHVLSLEAESIRNRNLKELEVALCASTWLPAQDGRELGLIFYDARVQPRN
jgi:hypothetical protein